MSTDHVTLKSDSSHTSGSLLCEHCGVKKKYKLPLAVTEMTDLLRSFTAEHKSCKNPHGRFKLCDGSLCREMSIKDKHKAEKSHPCPYLADVSNDSKTRCTCCSDCSQECADDI